MGNSVVTNGNKAATVKVINVLDTKYTLAKGRIIGQCQSVNVLPDRQIKKVSQVSVKNSKVPDHLTDLFDRSKTNLSSEQQDELRDLLYSYRDTFAKDDDDLGGTNVVKHRINTGNARPIKQAPCRQTLAKQEAEEKEVARILEQGVISLSNSPWASPTVLVQRKRFLPPTSHCRLN
ncbi:uncharacterized protein LOC125381581 [Haliotis rufescens]|uniref:uncharacterized protein LOC125381581 n=1 Tax=Haliotis rufescens TaxID=6454 RepID=UPI00201EF82E|nr:uncharacterized protein LOC125381581 [Haliotis rufescens]